MSDDLKPNPSTEDTSIENKDAAEVAIDSTDHLADSAETDSFETAQPKTSSDTPESAEASVEAPVADVSSTEEATVDDEESSVDEDKTSTATVSGIKSARAIPSITKTDTMVAAKSKSGDGDSDEAKETSEIEAVSPDDSHADEADDKEAAPEKKPFDPPPTQRKRFKEVRLDALREKLEGMADDEPAKDTPSEDAASATESAQASIGESSEAAQDAKEEAPAEEAPADEKATGELNPSTASDPAKERPDTNPMHPSTRQPRKPHSWQLQRNAADKPETKDNEEFPSVSIDLDTDKLQSDKVDASVSGAKAMPGMVSQPAPQEKDKQEQDNIDKTKPPSAIEEGDEQGKRSSFTFKMTGDKLDRDTAVLSKENPSFQRALSKQEAPDGTSTLGEQREVILVIRGMIERLIISEKEPFKLGRFEPGRKQDNEIDLTPYGALDRGVSRVHAQLELSGNNLYVSDLGSTNGTYLAGARLDPNQPALLHKGDDLLIGRLSVQVMFR